MVGTSQTKTMHIKHGFATRISQVTTTDNIAFFRVTCFPPSFMALAFRKSVFTIRFFLTPNITVDCESTQFLNLYMSNYSFLSFSLMTSHKLPKEAAITKSVCITVP